MLLASSYLFPLVLHAAMVALSNSMCLSLHASYSIQVKKRMRVVQMRHDLENLGPRARQEKADCRLSQAPMSLQGGIGARSRDDRSEGVIGRPITSVFLCRFATVKQMASSILGVILSISLATQRAARRKTSSIHQVSTRRSSAAAGESLTLIVGRHIHTPLQLSGSPRRHASLCTQFAGSPGQRASY
jgi:hypothetical protein